MELARIIISPITALNGCGDTKRNVMCVSEVLNRLNAVVRLMLNRKYKLVKNAHLK